MLGERTLIMSGGGASGGEICPSTTEDPNAKQVAQTRRQRINPSHTVRSVPGLISRWQRSQHTNGRLPHLMMQPVGSRILETFGALAILSSALCPRYLFPDSNPLRRHFRQP